MKRPAAEVNPWEGKSEEELCAGLPPARTTRRCATGSCASTRPREVRGRQDRAGHAPERRVDDLSASASSACSTPSTSSDPAKHVKFKTYAVTRNPRGDLRRAAHHRLGTALGAAEGAGGRGRRAAPREARSADRHPTRRSRRDGDRRARVPADDAQDQRHRGCCRCTTSGTPARTTTRSPSRRASRAPAASPGHDRGEGEIRRVIVEAIKELPDKEKKVLVLVLLRGPHPQGDRRGAVRHREPRLPAAHEGRHAPPGQADQLQAGDRVER